MIYLDHAATTPIPAPVAEEMMTALTQFANPSAQYPMGQEAKKQVEERRAVIAKALRCASECVHFTSCGTESDNWAIMGALHHNRHVGKHIITTAVEHSAILETCKALQQQGYEVTYLKPDKTGHVTAAQVEAALREDTVLVSVMLVNNETGALYDIDSAARTVRAIAPDALIHCDAVQGFLRQNLPRVSCGIDMISVSAHKIHGPKGVGALIVSPAVIKRRALSPVIYGGGQEEGLRSGTENLIGIAGFGKAATEGRLAFTANAEKLKSLYLYTTARLAECGVVLNIPENHVDHIISLTLPNIKSQTMLNFLSAKGICVSSGSACSSHDKKISPSLRAFGLSDKAADSTIRVSLCAENTREDLDSLVAALELGIRYLVKIK